ncbi:MAG: hypothetical protein AB9842_04965 [Bacteroidales bacterium]
MKRIVLLLFLGILFHNLVDAQSKPGLLIGDFNKVGDFISLRPQKTFDLDLLKDSPKFVKIKLGEKDLVLTYKITGEGKGAIRYFEPLKNEWVDVFTVDCCAHATRANFWIFDGKSFKQKNDVLFFYTEIYSDSARTQAEKRRLQIAKFTVGNAFRKYDMTLNAKTAFPHKVIVSKWIMREQFGEIEDKYKEFSLEDKIVTGF